MSDSSATPSMPQAPVAEAKVHAAPDLRRLLLRTASVAACFVLFVGAIMIGLHWRLATDEPLTSPELTELRQKLRDNPTDEALKQRIREIDLQLRRQYFRKIHVDRRGAWLLVIGAVTLVASLQWAAALESRLPQPKPDRDPVGWQEQFLKQARWATAAVGAVMLGGLLGLALGVSPPRLEALNTTADTVSTPAAPPPPAWPSEAEMQANWPRFRGPGGFGVAGPNVTNPPTHWNAETGEGILWKSEVPRPGFSSPVVWSNHVFVTGGDVEAREVYCFDATNGKLLWRQPVVTRPIPPDQMPEIPEMTGYAAPTAATDGRRVYAIFALGDLAAFDFEGKRAWGKSLGIPKNPYGHATSLLTWHDRLIVQFDQGEAEEGKSRLYALDAASGAIVWQQRRAVPASWTTPIVIEAAGRTQIVACAEPWVIAYDATNGNEIWRVQCLGGDLAPSPTFAGGLVIAVSPGYQLVAIKPDGEGDVTQTHVAWKSEDGVPDIASPVSNGQWLWTIGGDGTLTCFELRTGKVAYEKIIEDEFHASPTLAGGRLYLMARSGRTFILEPANEYREVAQAELGEEVDASPAFVGARLFIRAKKHLYCIGPATEAARTVDVSYAR